MSLVLNLHHSLGTAFLRLLAPHHLFQNLPLKPLPPIPNRKS